MKIKTTASYLMDNGYWEKYCEVTGMNEWAVNEGMDDKEPLYISNEDADKIGLTIKIS